MKKIILASASPRRFELLRQIGLIFTVKAPDIHEDITLELPPHELVKKLSYEKALYTANNSSEDSLVIGADTIVFKDYVLGKPLSEKMAFDMLKTLQGEEHEVLTGITVFDTKSMQYISDFEKTKVKMRQLSDDMIYAYIKTGEPMDKAGAYGIQGLGALLVEKIEGCYFNVVGLPLVKLSKILDRFDMNIL